MAERRLEWSRRAGNDFNSAIRFYADFASPALAAQFRLHILDVVNRIADAPLIHREGRNGTRECVVQRFPFTIVFRIFPGEIRIIRVLHQARNYFNH